MPAAQKPIQIDPGEWSHGVPSHRFSHDAMGTTFEIIIPGEEAQYAGQAARAAFDEAGRIEEQLSRFLPGSDVARINALGAGQSLRVGIAAMDCLRLASEVCSQTDGAFDVTIGSHDLLELDPQRFLVGVKADGVRVDLGGIGKGYAVDQMAALLSEWSIGAALIHSGQSTALAVGTPPDSEGWPLALRHPAQNDETLLTVHLRSGAISGSGLAVHGQHIIDPRTGQPVEGVAGSWAFAPTAALSDALSTAFMVMQPDEAGAYCAQHPEVSAIVAREGSAGLEVVHFGDIE